MALKRFFVMALLYLQPIDSEIHLSDYKPQQVGFQLQKYVHEGVFPDLEGVRIAFFCVERFKGEGNALRRHLYRLYMGNWGFQIADLGNLPLGETEEDTHFAVKELSEYLIRKGIIPLVVGGEQHITYAMYRAFDALEQMVNLVTVDAKFDFGSEQELFIESSYLSRILSEPPVNLLDYTNIGYQSYYVAQEELDLLEKMCFEAHRLGNITADLRTIEPAMRNADIISVDMSCVQTRDLGLERGYVNGLTNREICTVARYAGISSNVQICGIFEIPATDMAAQLVAEMIWYFYEGFNFRTKELPLVNDENYTKYIVPIEDIQLEFFKSNLTDRWWLKPGGDKYAQPQNHIPPGLIPCLEQEYEAAVQGVIPERWWRSYRKAL